jgi:hypothetical protein
VVTATGTLLLRTEPFPSWPLPPRPQQYAAPAVSSAQVKFVPASIWVSVFPASTPAVETGTGSLLLMVEPFPSWPLLLLPQQYARPLWIRQEWVAPATIAVADDEAAAAGGGWNTAPATPAPASRQSIAAAVTPRLVRPCSFTPRRVSPGRDADGPRHSPRRPRPFLRSLIPHFLSDRVLTAFAYPTGPQRIGISKKGA